MSKTVPYKELSKLAHLKINEEDYLDRFIPMFALYDTKWNQFFNTENGLININSVDVVDGLYFAKEAVEKDDLKLIFFNLMYKKANFKDKSEFIYYILDDIQNLSASVEKINYFYTMHNQIDSYVLSKYVSTELEYIFKVSRSVFDLLQELINVIWNKFQYIDSNIYKKVFNKKSRTSFTSVIENNKKLLSINELMLKHTIPEELAKFYYYNGEFFYWLKSYRDKISHSGKSFDIFIGEEGFSLSIKKNHFSDLHVWNDKNTLKNDLGSVKTLVSYVVLNTINALDEYAKTINSIVKLPNDIAPDYNLYLRSKFNTTLKELHTYIDDNAWNN